MSRYMKDKNGKFAGSIGDGKDNIPAPSDVPRPQVSSPPPGGPSTPHTAVGAPGPEGPDGDPNYERIFTTYQTVTQPADMSDEELLSRLRVTPDMSSHRTSQEITDAVGVIRDILEHAKHHQEPPWWTAPEKARFESAEAEYHQHLSDELEFLGFYRQAAEERATVVLQAVKKNFNPAPF